MRKLANPWKTVVLILSFLWCVFVVYTSISFSFHPMLQGAISLGWGLVLVFMLFPARKKGSPVGRPSLLDGLLVIASLVVCINVGIQYEYYEEVAALSMSNTGILLGVLTLILVLEGTRRSLGSAVPILALCFLAYVFFGNVIPGYWGHSGYSFGHVIWQLYQTTNGYWGVVTDIVSRVVLVFIIFGPVFFITGAGKSFIGLANFVGGRIKGGAGQVAVIGSAFFGMFSGSAVANVATVGTFTIPLMKKTGFKNKFAGAVEAASSSGGQIMPPVMGSGAFIMADFLGRPYLEIAIAAIIPALLYYLGIGFSIYFEASRTGLSRLPKDMMPKAGEVFYWKNLSRVFIPLGVLVALLIMFLPPQTCAGWALLVTIALFILTGGGLNWSDVKKRLLAVPDAFLEAIQTLCWLMVMIVCIQTVVCLIGLTGFGVKFAALVMAIGKENLILSLILTMIAVAILGMGMPTVAAYVIGISAVGPALMKLGVPAFPAHFFVFFYAVMSAITPPVAVAAYPAAALAECDWVSMCWIAIKLAAIAFLIPFFFIFNPALLMQGDTLNILLTGFLSLLGIIGLASGGIGYFLKPATWAERIFFVLGGILLFLPNPIARLVGAVLMIAGLLSQKYMPAFALIGQRPPAVR